MKIQCDVCEKVEAAVLCCADEAALCWGCDEKVHAANKLAGKHQRLPLLNPSSHVPSCDICQMTRSQSTYLVGAAASFHMLSLRYVGPAVLVPILYGTASYENP
uniref:B box-type domain-containing protein n=1 Tax=Nelumbo nucifera TaxID=4432 RepID=A0A822Z2B5_NELNU|nr:TPA_asm: hypothetical protein HUJ06_013142 [Nelumbo nucifera]